ncbi:MAG: BACON domain-containing protein [Paludibacter sp.]|nr:BACON domain-containing protein [Paludibacter sp.]
MEKKNLFYVMATAALLLSNGAFMSAQVTVGSDKTPEKFALLELISGDNKGLRLPHMTTEERNAMANDAFKASIEAQGLQIFNTTTYCVETWNGSAWIEQCAPPPILEVNPENLMFTHVAGGGGDQTVTVTTNQPSWTVADAPSWVSWAISNNTLIVNVPNANSGVVPLTGTIIITAGTLTATIYVTQGIDLSKITEGGTLPADTYIGAFWRYNQKGERIIRIRGIAAADAGAWTASVGWYDGQWNAAGGDGIIFSTDPTTDTGVNFNAAATPADMNVPANDSIYSVTGSAVSASGTVTSGGIILFRIGLQKKFTAYKPDDNASPNPARYAVVILSYANNTKVQEIFIRQGEGADYVMTPTDAINSGGMNNPAGFGARPAAVKFSPYNLTATNLNTSVTVNGGTWTVYPTQAGAYFQWANQANLRYAYDPYTANVPAGITWDDTPQAAYWNTLGDTHETCPDGYRRPNDGITNNVVTTTSASASGSEMRQSLWWYPQTSTGYSDFNNSVWGYYADGFFDRRQITNGVGTNPGTGSSVSTTNYQIAHRGRLFYNPTTNASLFFPAAGYRHYTMGVLYYLGDFGYYYSSSSSGMGTPWYLGARINMAAALAMYSTYGLSVRCVKK